MPRRSVLTPQQRARFEATLSLTDQTERQFLRYYTLSPEDLDRVKQRRQSSNRLGFAIQLCYLRYPGRALRPDEKVSHDLLSFVAKQLRLHPKALDNYAGRDSTRREHLALLRQLYGYQSFTAQGRQLMLAWLLPVAKQTTLASRLTADLYEEMRGRRLIAPGINVVEDLVAQALHQADRQVFKALIGDLSDGQRQGLDALLELHPDSLETTLTWLRKPVASATIQGILRLLDRIEYIDALELGDDRTQRIHQNRLLTLARQGAKTTAQHLSDFEPARRYATLVALLLQTRGALLDEVVQMHDRLWGKWLKDCQSRFNALAAEHGAPDIAAHLRLYVLVGDALINARDKGTDAFAAMDAVVAWETFCDSVENARQSADQTPLPSNHLALLDTRYGVSRRYSPRLLETLPIKGSASAQDVVAALKVQRLLNTNGRRELPKDAPCEFVKGRWQAHVLTDEGPNRRYWELCLLSTLRDRLRSGDVTVPGSRQFTDFDSHLLASSRFEEMLAKGELPVAVECDCDTYLEQRLEKLRTRLGEVSERAERQELSGSTIKDGKLKMTRLRRVGPEGQDALARQVYRLLPRIKITDLLVEVDGWTDFTSQFEHMQPEHTQAPRRQLLAALLADATNLGLTRMAQSCPGLSYRTLVWTSDWYLREETYRRALAAIVDSHHDLKFPQHWGQGTSSSSDGQRFRVSAAARATGTVNAHYGSEPSVMFYTHVSDQYAPFHVSVIDATVRDATYVLDGLLYHETALPVKEHYTDTAGFTDHVFALCHLLGFRFVPRIRRLGSHRLYTPDKTDTYPGLEGLLGGTLSVRAIKRQWDEVLRLVSSIKLGKVTASLMLRKLGAYRRQNGLALALRELGRLERTLHMLDWIEDEEYRRRALVGLNKGEAEHALSRAVFFGRSGEVRDRSRAGQLQRASGLKLVLAAIVLWNTVYIERAVQYMNDSGQKLSDEQVAHLSPLGWEHINFIGDYLWQPQPHASMQHLRPIRKPVEDGLAEP